jgi:hypothetical protein
MNTFDRSRVRIGVALLRPDSVLEQLLEQIGVSWQVLAEAEDPVMDLIERQDPNDGFAGLLPSCIILNKPLRPSAKMYWKEHVRLGTVAILDLEANLFDLASTGRLIGTAMDPDDAWLGDYSDLPWGPVMCRTSPSAAHADRTLHLRKDLAYAWSGWPFSSPTGSPAGSHASYPGPFGTGRRWSKNPHPSERSAGSLRSVSRHHLEDILIHLHTVADLPFTHRAAVPAGADHALLFRVDSDYGGSKEVDSLFGQLDRHGVRSTWFLHTSAHEPWLGAFDGHREHEMALHCDRHAVHSDPHALRSDLRRGLDRLHSKLPNREIRGVAAPFGLYGRAYAELLADPSFHRFDYSSEFSFDADNLPLRPSLTGSPLQIPVHPICPGSFRRTLADDASVAGYFKARARLSAFRRDPLAFYHHPMQDDRGALDALFSDIAAWGEAVERLTFSEWHDWWHARSQTQLIAVYDRASRRLTVSTGPSGKHVRDSAPSRGHDIRIVLDRDRHVRAANGSWSLSELAARAFQRRNVYLLGDMDRAYRINLSHRQRFHHVRSDLLDRLGRSLQ